MILATRGQLFKIIGVVSKRFVKISNGNVTNTLLFCVEKIAKDSRILSIKSNSVFAYVVGIYLKS